ncbi:MAG: hypothetical protein HW373_1550 [Deltaproteobacteria bacterium]|nr:hypothetical protein [Deltaproteobacteria bacterium]
MSEREIRDYSTTKGFHPQTLERWLSWQADDADALARLASALKISENHLRDLMDWLEEISLRDRQSIQAILTRKSIDDSATDPRLGRADRLKRIKEQIRRLRFPRLAETEDAIRAKIQDLNLHPEIRVSVPPGLEGGQVRVEFAAASHAELKQLARKLTEAADQASMPEIFDLLAGHTINAATSRPRS